MNSIAKIFGTIFTVNLLRYLIFAGIPFMLFYYLFANKLSRYKIQQRLARKKDFIREIAHSAQTSVVLAVIAVVVLRTPLRNFTLIYDTVNDYPLWYIGAGLLLSLVIHDTYFYWLHRLLHHKTIYRYTHVVHHKSVNPSPFTSYSFHILEAVTEGLVLIPIVMLLPMHRITIILFTLTGFIINVYGHLGYEVAPKGLRNSFLFGILNTSVYHNLHHSKFKGNYGLYFRFWDRLMKTENPDYVTEYDRLQEQRFGKL